MKRHRRQESCLPLDLVRQYGQEYPSCWELLDSIHAQRGTGPERDWPEWCWLPMGWSATLVAEALGTDRPEYRYLPIRDRVALRDQLYQDGAMLSALAVWRHSKQIYQFDVVLADELRQSGSPEEIPAEALRHLPFPCMYIQIPTITMDGTPFEGFFCHLEYDQQTGDTELRFLLVGDQGQSYPASLHLDTPTIKDAFKRYREVALERQKTDIVQEFRKQTPTTVDDFFADQEKLIRSLLPLVLYLCSAEADIQPAGSAAGTLQKPEEEASPAPDPAQGTVEKPIKDKYSEVRTWDVGFRVGPAIRKARTEERPEPGASHHTGTGTPKRPHIRRGHWHHYWRGPRDGERTVIVRWLPPMAINTDTDDPDRLPAVSHRVKGELREDADITY